MKHLVVLLSLIATPALAQSAPPPEPPQVQALRALLGEANAGKEQAVTTIFQMREQLTAMQNQITDLRRQLESKNAPAKPETKQ